jgi:prepilin-type N-terminal cleavage/methylation domain-containing protein
VKEVPVCRFSPKRWAFTLIELLVVIAIIAILIALLVPAVQKVRESAARTQCVNNLKQMMLAINNYHDVNKMLPSAGYSGQAEPASWCPQFQILPFIEQATMYNAVIASCPGGVPTNNATYNANAGVPTFICPSRGRGTLLAVPGGNSPGLGGPFTDYKLDLYNNRFGSSGPGNYAQLSPRITMSNITNARGTSNSIYFGEGSMDPGYSSTTNSSNNWDECIFSGGYGGNYRSSDIILQDQKSNLNPPGLGSANNNYWGSSHTGVTVFGFLDGHATPINNDNSQTAGFDAALDYLSASTATMN